jgi:selenocysteine-specific elongation factor
MRNFVISGNDEDVISRKRHLVIGTAGHVDHGKSTLIQAITGQNPDRLKEELARGLTIVPGFAHFENSGGIISFIDVPGHEKYLDHMLVGSHGVNMTMLVIACDDGIMPQTVEHFLISRLLGVDDCIVVFSKVDMVSSERSREVSLELDEFFHWAGAQCSMKFHWSSNNRIGLDIIRTYLEGIAGQIRKSHNYVDVFRMPVDRFFHIQGHGQIVTGTVISGILTKGESVNVSGCDTQVRIRSIQVHGKEACDCSEGHRAALNVVFRDNGEKLNHRIVYSGPSREPETLFLARISSISNKFSPEKVSSRGLRVRVHSNGWKCFAKIAFLEASSEETAFTSKKYFGYSSPSDHFWVRLTVEEPVMVWPSDRFIIRNGSDSKTLGGGMIYRCGFTEDQSADFQGVLKRASDYSSYGLDFIFLEIFLSAVFGCRFDDLMGRLGVNSESLEYLFSKAREVGLIRVFGRGFQRMAVEASSVEMLCREIVDSLEKLHGRHPLTPGFSLKEITDNMELSRKISPELLEHLLILNEAEEHVNSASNGGWCIKASAVNLSEARYAPARKARNFIQENNPRPVSFSLMRDNLGNEASLRRTLQFLVNHNLIVRLVNDHYMLIESFGEFRNSLFSEFGVGSRIDVGLAREKWGIGRKAVILILETMDEMGLTLRNGDERIIADI